jgi:hypothetical protein
MRGFGQWILMAALTLLGITTAHADSMRCGKYLVNTGDSQSRVLDICGEPQSARQDGFIEQAALCNDKRCIYYMETRRIIPVYKWDYNLGHGRFLKILTFHGDTLVDIADGPRQ